MSLWDNWMGQTSQKPAAPATQTPPANGGNPSGTQTNPGNDPQNNSGTNQDLIATIWDEQKDKDKTPADPAQTPPSNQPGNQPGAPSDEQLRAQISTHLGSVGLGELQLTQADVEKLTGENSHQELVNLVNTRIQQSYLQAINTAQKAFTKLLDERLPKAIEDAVGQSKAFFNGNELRSSLIKEMPWADDPAIQPMAETVFRQFLVKGATREKALQLTKDYFQRVRQAMDPDFVPPSANTRTTFRGNPRTAINFVDVLKGN